MDGDPAVEPELNSFSLLLPLPYRIAVIVVLGTWGWGINLQYLYSQKIDVPSLIRYPSRNSVTEPPHHQSAYRLAAAASAALGVSLALFWALTRHDPALVLAYDWLPMTTLAVLGLLLVLPFPPLLALRRGTAGGSRGLWWWTLPREGRRRFAAMLRRVAVGGLAEAAQGKFGDILLADVITSYSKVLADLFVCLTMFFVQTRAGREASATDRPDRNCGGTVIVPLLMAAPYAARFRQCLIEYVRVRRAPFRESVGWGGQHLANAGKYFSSFPVILLSALLRSAEAAETPDPARATRLYRAWVAAVFVNSMYSFYWDVTKDWDLSLLDGARQRNAPGQPWGLRRRLYIQPAPTVYYVVIVMDFLLRCTWSLKLSPHLDHLVDFESSLFLIELLEVFRRWVWIFFRVETEWIRSTNTGLGVDDILLGDYQGKFDDDDEDD